MGNIKIRFKVKMCNNNSDIMYNTFLVLLNYHR